MPTLDLSPSREESRLELELSAERFDRVAFALRAIDVVRPARTTVAVCEGIHRLRVEAGRAWGKGEDDRWAIVSVPPTASRRSIAMAVLELAAASYGHGAAEPYVLDVLLAESVPAT
jgi:hypothetical protein